MSQSIVVLLPPIVPMDFCRLPAGFRVLFAFLLGALALAANTPGWGGEVESRLLWRQLPPIPDREGFAGSFAGVSGTSLLVAGGANFPDRKPWEGGTKVWYDSVFALDRPDGPWRVVGKLPRPLGYGISITTPQGVMCIGGSDATGHVAEVFLLRIVAGSLRAAPLPSLPVPLAHGAGALVASTVFVFGGADAPGEQTASNRLFALDLSAEASAWKELEPCPGQPRILPVATAVDGAFFVAGGAALEASGDQRVRVYLRDAWRYDAARKWARLADMPQPAVAAASPAPAWDARFLVIGGDDGSRVGFTPVEQHPGFPPTVLVYDTVANAWHRTGPLPAPRATLPVTWWRDRFVLPGGETRPGVRSPEVWTLHRAP